MTEEQWATVIKFLNQFENHLERIEVYLEQLTRGL